MISLTQDRRALGALTAMLVGPRVPPRLRLADSGSSACVERRMWFSLPPRAAHQRPRPWSRFAPTSIPWSGASRAALSRAAALLQRGRLSNASPPAAPGAGAVAVTTGLLRRSDARVRFVIAPSLAHSAPRLRSRPSRGIAALIAASPTSCFLGVLRRSSDDEEAQPVRRTGLRHIARSPPRCALDISRDASSWPTPRPPLTGDPARWRRLGGFVASDGGPLTSSPPPPPLYVNR